MSEMEKVNSTRRKILCGMASMPLMSLLASCEESVPEEYILAQNLNLDLTVETINRAKNLLSLQPAVDIHAHPGRFFLEGITSQDPSVKGFLAQGIFPEKTIMDMKASGLAATCFSIVGDMKSLTFTRKGIKAAHALEEGELWADYHRQIQGFHKIRENMPIYLVKTPDEILKKKGGKVGAILTAEGSDFLEGKIERLKTVFDDDIRAITIVHYRINEAGDIQTEAPRHGGLTSFGAELISGMNSLGMIVDLAHASFETVKQAVAVTNKPVMLSHSHLVHEGNKNPRLISAEHARLIADTGGVVGAWPAGITQHNLVDYVDEIMALVNVIGIDHVSLGTDMDTNYKPVFDNYRQLPLVTALLLNKGLSEGDTAKILGGNFMRLFREVTSV